MKTIKTLAVSAVCSILAFGAQAAEPCKVDVLFAIDAKASAYLWDEKETSLESYVADQTLMMNEVLTNSGLSAKFVFRSVGVYELGFEATRVDPTKYLTRDVLEQATLGQGQWAKLHNERDNRGADIVSVIVDTGDKYGHVGDSNSLTDLNDVAGFSENAYSVVGVRSTFDWHALLHEVGHNFGAGHAGGADQSAPYSHGWYFVEAPATTNAYTVMAYLKYDAKGQPIPEAPIFSSPKLTWKGAVAGDANTADNVRVIEQTYEGVSKWRKAPDDPPTGAVGPYMTTSWDQHSPFNDFAAVCGSEKAPCGCAATAAVQMFKYYGWPIRLDTAMTGEAHKYVDDVSYPFTLRFDGHNAFQWATMKDRASENDVVGNYEAARATLWCDTIGAMDFRPGDSSAQFGTMAESATLWFEKGQSYSYSYHGEEALWAALVAALDRKELVQVMLTGHQVVADGYAIEAGVRSVHINWGTNDSQTKWYTWDALKGIGIIEFWTGFRPKKTAQMRLLPKKMAAGVVTVSWDFPNVYTNDVTGFSYTRYVTTTSKGDYTGDGGTITPDCADNYYQPGVFGITGTSTFDYTMTSYYVWGLKVELQARFDAGEWVTIDTPTLSGAESEEVYKKSVDLSAWSGKEAEFRFKASRTGKMTASSARISFAAPKMKNVYRPLGDSNTIPGGAGVRAFALLNTSNAGRVISVKITPLMTGGVSSEPISVKLAKSDETVPAQPAIVSLDSMSSEITDGFRRTCGIGKSVFFVKVNETTTDVTAFSSHLALVGDDAVLTKKLDDTTWAVTIDAEDAPVESQMILTIVASDAIGNKSYKDLQLTFRSGEGGAEQEDMLAEKIAAGNFLYVPTGTEVTLPLDDTRFVAGKGTVTFDGGMPSEGPERGFNYQDSWKGLVKFVNFTPTATDLLRINYEFVNVNSEVQIGGDPKPDPNEMYHNTLSAKNEDIKVMRGQYGTDIEVPPVGYYATAFDTKTTLGTSGTGIGGSYADIIIKNGGDNDTRQHTFAGWFCASDLSAERILWFAYANDGIQRADNGYKVCVTTEGKIKIVKTSMDAQDNGSAIYSEDAVMSAGKWAHIAVAFSWGGGGQGNRWLKPTLFVNGVQQALTGGTTIGSNLNGDTGAIVQIGAGVTAAGIYVDKTAIADAVKVASFATNACYVVKGKEIMPEPPVPGVDLYWNGNAWTNAAGTVVTPVAESVLHTKEGDVVPYTSAVVGTFDGAGTVKLSNANASTSSALSKWVTNGNFSATFSGALWLAKGRFEASAPVSQNVTIKVTDGAQLSANGSEWSNRFVLSGDGWDGEPQYAVSKCSLRVEASIGASATLEFVKDGDVVPAIGSYNSTRSIAAGLVGNDGFRIVTGGTMKFTAPLVQTASLYGSVAIDKGMAQFGNGSAGDTTTEFRFGDKVTVNGQATFILHTRTDSVVDVRTDNKAKFATAIDLNGGTLHMEDGSYVFTKDVTVLADSTMVFKWRKGRVFQSLKGSAVLTVQGTCNPNASEADGYAVFAGGDFSGTIRSTANATKAVNLYVVPLGEALKAATVDLVAQGKLRLTEDATIGALSGTKPIVVTNAGDVHTLTIAKGATLVADTTNAALVSDANLVLDGVAITLKDYEATACYLASAPAISAKGTTLDPAGWKLTLERVGEQDVLKAVPPAPFLFFIK